MNSQLFDEYFHKNGWTIVSSEEREAKEPTFLSVADLGLSSASLQALAAFKNGVYQHQHESIASYMSGQNLAMTTSTASGKTLVFNVCALEELSAKPKARILAIYPIKALAAEQTERWKSLLLSAGLPTSVGRIDGGVETQERLKILKESRVVVMTPDIIHAWLLSSIATPTVLEFLRALTLVITDEAHTYTGVFGSNAAFLFRRMIHASKKLGGSFRFIASSATMQDAQVHLLRLTGETFKIVGPESDTSPRSRLKTLLVTPPNPKDMLTSVSDLITFAAMKTDHQSITFVDSRKQTEYLASIIERKVGEDVKDSPDEVDFKQLRDLQVYPYRSGYEEEDRQRIQNRLASGKLKGVVSTSALEMGIDLPYLTLGILVGIPRSATSLFQRIGRVGRRHSGLVIIVNNGSVVSESVFRDPSRLQQLPLVQSALYLHNQRIQYIHAMCLARRGGEDDSVSAKAGAEAFGFSSPIELPLDYAALCAAERVGEISTELQAMKAQAGDDPNHTFPLRDLETQFRVVYKHGPNAQSLGSLSQSQVMREAYPGAVYFYQTRTYRVVSVKNNERLISVRPEKRYFTTPLTLPTWISPNLSGENIFQAQRYGELVVMECALQVAEAVIGFKERRGNNEFNVEYPLDPALGLYHSKPKYARYSFTSGVVFTHPALNSEQVKGKCAAIAVLISEAFLMSLPFERQDINSGADRHRITRDPVSEGDRFVCVYDQTYGSLRLTSHLMTKEVIREVLAHAVEVATHDNNFQLGVEACAAIKEMLSCVQLDPINLEQGDAAMPLSERYISVMLPGSTGIDIKKDNEEFEVEGVFFSPLFQSVAYRGQYVVSKKKALRVVAGGSATTITVRADHIRQLEAESTKGYFDLETGQLLETLPLPGEF